jgi:hypothetical protein
MASFDAMQGLSLALYLSRKPDSGSSITQVVGALPWINKKEKSKWEFNEFSITRDFLNVHE